MIIVPNQGLLSKSADYCMIPVMYILQGNFRETPQRTHFWNNTKLTVSDIEILASELFVTVAGEPHAGRRWFGPVPIFHMPIFGGWKKCIVIAPVDPSMIRMDKISCLDSRDVQRFLLNFTLSTAELKLNCMF